MIGELEVPLGIDARPLEEGIDLVARHLYFARYAEARAALRGTAQATGQMTCDRCLAPPRGVAPAGPRP